LTIEQVLVVHDDLDLPPGIARLKRGGGHGGHNGLKDAIAYLGGPQFMRLRIGIGHPGRGADVTHYVLNAPLAEEQTAILVAIQTGLTVLPLILEGQWDRAVQQLHT
jgi:PTH1 family peptidyl-tRNA hydrolase